MRGARIAFGALLVSATLVFGASPADAAPNAISCPGKERWPVKTGTDKDRNSVNVAQVVPTTIAEMRSWPAPKPRKNDERADVHEMTVYSITGFLTKYKREPDQDFHLVIADAQKRTVIVEVPNPLCVGGASPFRASITAARAVVEDAISVTGSYPANDSKIPVRVVGVGFFDKAAHGAGAPPNGIELHPVLQIVFEPSGATTPAAGAGSLSDPGFEAGSSAWRASDSVISSGKKDSHTGSRFAWLGGYGRTHTDTLSQQVTLPSAPKVTLTYWLRIDTNEQKSTGSFEAEVFDTLTVEIRSPGGAVLDTLVTYSNREAAKNYQRRVLDLTSFAGQTIALWFVAEEDHSKQTSFRLDDFTIETQ